MSIISKHKPAVIWFTGLPGSGKTTLSQTLYRQLEKTSRSLVLVDGDTLRPQLSPDLGFSKGDRYQHLQRTGQYILKLLKEGNVVMVAMIAPYTDIRLRLRSQFAPYPFIEVYCRCPLDVCEQRDPKGLYRAAREGRVNNFTGIGAPYEPPENPELILDTATTTVAQCMEQLERLLKQRGLLLAEKPILESAL